MFALWNVSVGFSAVQTNNQSFKKLLKRVFQLSCDTLILKLIMNLQF